MISVDILLLFMDIEIFAAYAGSYLLPNIYNFSQVKLVLELERFFPHLQWALSEEFLIDYNKQTERIYDRQGTKFTLKDVLSKVSIFSNLEDRGAGGDDGTLERMAENVRQLGKVVRGLDSQLENLMEETSELKVMMTKLEAKIESKDSKCEMKNSKD